MVAPVIVGTPTTFASAVSGATIALDVPTVGVTLQDGDVLVAGLRTSGSTSPSDFAASGFTRRGKPFVASSSAERVTGLYVHVVTDAASEPTSHTFTKSVADARRSGVMFVVRGVDVASAIIGESSAFTSAAPTVTLNSFALSTSDEALLVYLWGTEIVSTNASEPTALPGPEIALVPSPGGTGVVRTVLWAGAETVAATASGAQALTWTSAAGSMATGFALRGESAPPLPSSGLIGSRIPTSVTHDSITVGVDRIGGDVVEVSALLGSTEVDRKTVTIDGTSGWGSATFTGLEGDTPYGFEFYVDGVRQTDTEALIRTNPVPGTPTSFKFIAGSCQFTGSNHPIWDRIREENARGIGHMGDLTYADTADLATWRSAVEASLTAPRFRAMLGLLPMTWTWDNHDRIIADDGGGGSPLNFGRTDPATLENWRQLAGDAGWASSDTGGRTWVIGRVRFIQTDNWTAKTDPDAGLPGTPTFLGAAQKQWFKDTLDAATEPVIVWLCQWTTAVTGSGRWNSYQAETDELEAFIDARPDVKARMVMIGGDSHSPQVTDGSRTEGNFVGIPSYNISGFNRSSDTGHGGTGWTYDGALRTSAQPEADWGGYSRLTFDDDGTVVTLTWDGVRVGPDGVSDVMFSQTKQFGAAPLWDAVSVGSTPVTAISVGSTQIWP